MKIRHKYKWAMFGLDDAHRKIVCLGDSADKSRTVHDLAATLPENECRYVVFEHSFKTSDGRPQDKLFFISWFPRTVSSEQKMLYATARAAVRGSMPGCLDLTAGSRSELLDGVLRAKDAAARPDDDEADDAGGDWMDE